ncbi:MAG: VTC domain-containing protein [Eggerthellaceae bacterium]
MKPYSEVFERVEKKYLVTREERSRIEDALAPYLQPDSYGCSRITSLYLDTEYDEVIARSLEQPLYKEKIRLRAYGDVAGMALTAAFSPCGDIASSASFGRESHQGALEQGSCRDVRRAGVSGPFWPGGLVFCELKKKYSGVVYKRRIGLSLAAAVDYMGGRGYWESCIAYPCSDPKAQQEALCPLSMQIAREIDAARARYDRLRPRMAIEYLRTAWVPRPEFSAALGDLRITFDGGPRYKALYRDGSKWCAVTQPGESIMEVKSSTPFPLWLVRVLSENGVYSRSFTKYGTAHLLAARSFAEGLPQRQSIRSISNRKE